MKDKIEQLTKDLAKEQLKNENLVSLDVENRKEFAKALSWRVFESDFGYSSRTSTPKTPTWSEIFVELGKLLEIKETTSDHQTVKMLSDALIRFEKEFNEKFPKN